jgi:recombination protein RecA
MAEKEKQVSTSKTGDKQLKDLATAVANFDKNIRKNTGKPKLYVYSTVDQAEGVEVIPFGLPDADAATVVGGIPRGKIIELFGLESGGKSWLTLRLMASAQRMKLKTALIDLEHSLDPSWAEDNGVDLDSLIYGHDFKHGEEALEYVLDMVKTKTADVIVIDSTAALNPKGEFEEDEKDGKPSTIKVTVGLLARLMSQAVRRISDACGKTGVTVIFVNQIREKVGVMFGNPETTPGGRALKFYSSMRLDVRRVNYIKEKQGGEEVVVGMTSKFTVIKNKVAPPQGTALFEVYYFPDSQSPLAKLAKIAYELKALPRKTIEDKMQYVWGKGKDAIPTGCETFADVAKWFEACGQETIRDLIESVKEKAKEKEKVIDEALIQQISDEFLTVENPTEEDQADTEEKSKG